MIAVNTVYCLFAGISLITHCVGLSLNILEVFNSGLCLHKCFSFCNVPVCSHVSGALPL